MKLTELKQLVRECVREIKEEASNSPEASGLLNGQSNQVAASRVNKLLSAISKGIFSDQSWEGINKIFAKLKEAGIEFDLLGAKYGGHADSRDGMPTYKEWQISIPFTNNKGKQVDLVGQITAHGSGTVEDPLSRYDITAYVTPVAKRIREEYPPYDPESDTFMDVPDEMNWMNQDLPPKKDSPEKPDKLGEQKNVPQKTETYDLPDLKLPGSSRPGGLMIVDYFPNEVKVRYWQQISTNNDRETEPTTLSMDMFNQYIAPKLKQKNLVDTTFYDPQTGKVVKSSPSGNPSMKENNQVKKKTILG